ncbi:MAG: hypothetical protein MK033_03780 [Candidatus Caenarcaniphilales bacterium]|nr:hypothetical protein [Candidatus Caenarcaniphilales bacterium]
MPTIAEGNTSRINYFAKEISKQTKSELGANDPTSQLIAKKAEELGLLTDSELSLKDVAMVKAQYDTSHGKNKAIKDFELEKSIEYRQRLIPRGVFEA